MSKQQIAEEALTVRTTSSVLATVEGYDPKDLRGKEGITAEDLRLPFLAIAQKTSKALDASEGAYMEDLKFLDMYNSETKEIYGPGPLRFLPIRHRKRANLLTEDNKFGDQVDWNDPRVIPPWAPGSPNKDIEDLEGVRVYDWAVLLLPSFQLVVVSFKSKSFPAGQSLATFVQTRNGPAFAGQYVLRSILDKNIHGNFGKFQVIPDGKPDPAAAEFAEQVYESIKDKAIVVTDDEPVVEEVATERASVREPVPF